MNIEKFEVQSLNNILDELNNPVIGKALLTTFHKLNYCGYKKPYVLYLVEVIAIRY